MPRMPLLIEQNMLTLPKLMKSKGYSTGCIGKWHLGWGDHKGASWKTSVTPGTKSVGFDYFFGVPYSHNCPADLLFYVENDKIFGRKPKAPFKSYQRNYQETAITLSGKALEFIEKNQKKPFFLYYPMTNVHAPHTPHKQFKGKTNQGNYGDFVVEFDWAVGEIMKTLDRLQLTDNTLIIVTSDNGAERYWGKNGHKSNGALRGTKGTIYEAGHRIPFLARWPGRIKPQTICDQTISTTDFMATCAAIIEEKLPETAAIDSHNILPLLLGDSDKPVRSSTIHHSVSGLFAIRMGDWKYIDGRGNGMDPVSWGKVEASGKNKPLWNEQTEKFEALTYDWLPAKVKKGEPHAQLYNLKNDPLEKNNLYLSKPELVEKMKQLLEKVRQRKTRLSM